MGWTGSTFSGYRCWYITVFPPPLLIIVSLMVLSVIIMVCVLYIIILHSAVRTVDRIREFRESHTVSYINKAFDYNENVHPPVHETSTTTISITISAETITEISEKPIALHDLRVNGQIRCGVRKKVRKNFLKMTRYLCKRTVNNHPSKMKAVKTVLLILLCFVGTWTPYYVAIILYVKCDITKNVSKMARSVVCFLMLAIALAQGRHEKYENHQLYRVAGPSQEIEVLEAHLDIISATPAARSVSGQLEALVRLSPEDKQKWLEYFDKKQMKYTKMVDNLAEILRDEDVKINNAKQAAKRRGRSISWDAYYRYKEINEYLDYLGEEYSDLVTVINAALSYEGRQIKYVKISTSRFEDLRKPVVIIDAAVHAREWVTPPVALYIINQLVVDIVDSNLTDGLDWIIIPLANPDGYEYSIDEDRMWRKTRSKAHDGAEDCPGVDGNRNFDHYFGTREASANPCSLIYEGPAPFSEPEIRVIRDVVLQNLNRAALYISLHSYGNMFLYAWGNNGTLPANGLILHLAGVRMATAIEELSLDKADPYVVGNAANVLYYTTGTSRDWTRAVGIPLTYTLELPGYEYGFLVPPEYVEQIVTETWEGIAAGAHYVLSTF
ncbi:unnamed protein product, partial [Iphiclides podalirius]